MNVLFPDRLRYRECHWTSWLPAPLLGADFFACEWGNPDVSERVNRTTRIAQVFRYLLLSSIIMTAGASLHTSVNQHAQRHWCITPVVWQRHQDTHRSAIRPHRALYIKRPRHWSEMTQTHERLDKKILSKPNFQCDSNISFGTSISDTCNVTNSTSQVSQSHVVCLSGGRHPVDFKNNPLWGGCSGAPTAESSLLPMTQSSSSTLLTCSVHLYGHHHCGLPSFVQHSVMQATWKTWEHSSAISSSVRWFMIFWQMQHWGKSLSSGWSTWPRSWQTFPQTQPN